MVVVHPPRRDLNRADVTQGRDIEGNGRKTLPPSSTQPRKCPD